MKGSKIEKKIISDWKREEYFKQIRRNECVVNEKKQCDTCKYKKICKEKD